MTSEEKHVETAKRNDTTKNLPRSRFRGTVQLGGVTIECHVLNDERRVLAQRDLIAALSGGSPTKNAHFERAIARISSDSADFKVLPRVEFVAQGGVSFGYPVGVLTAVCDTYVDRLIDGSLHPKQRPIARRARVLQKAWATVGLMALVDEATGYQEHRSKTALQDELALLLRASAGPYEPLFSDEFFRELARLYRTRTDGHRRPRFFGKFIKRYFYKWLSPAVWQELNSRLPMNDEGRRSGLMHPHLTEGARSIFERHQDSVITLMRTSGTAREFDENFAVAFRGRPLQLRLAS